MNQQRRLAPGARCCLPRRWRAARVVVVTLRDASASTPACSDAASFELRFVARRTMAGRRWLRAVREATAAGLAVREPYRVYNAPGGPSVRELLAELAAAARFVSARTAGVIGGVDVGRMESAVTALETETTTGAEGSDPTAGRRALTRGLQEALNDAHVHFERMRGSIPNPSPIWLAAPPAVRKGIERFNVLIHAVEDAARNAERRARGKPSQPRVVVTLEGRRRYRLSREELEGFALARTFGTAYLNYAEVGKHLLEACLDDEGVSSGAIVPQAHGSADTLVWLGPDDEQDEVAELEDRLATWWEREGVERRFPRDDPASAVGYLPVADLITEDAPEDIVARLANAEIVSMRAR